MYEYVPQEDNNEANFKEQNDAFVEDEGRLLGVVRRVLHTIFTPNADQREKKSHSL